jgi:predicted nucleic acid-binding protein
MNDDGTAAYMISGGLNGGHKKLSKYDRYVIAIAGEVNILAVSNDKPVRELCNSYDIKITETLGVVCSAYENDLISFKVMVEGLEFLFSEESTCYLSNSLKRKIFKYYSI